MKDVGLCGGRMQIRAVCMLVHFFRRVRQDLIDVVYTRSAKGLVKGERDESYLSDPGIFS